MLDAPYDGRIMAKLAKPFININITEDQGTRLSSPVLARALATLTYIRCYSVLIIGYKNHLEGR